LVSNLVRAGVTPTRPSYFDMATGRLDGMDSDYGFTDTCIAVASDGRGWF